MCNVDNFCLGKSPRVDKSDYLTPEKQLIKNHDPSKYPDLTKEEAPKFEDLRKIYEDTQNSILNCATMKSKYELHKSIMDDYDIPDRSKKILEQTNQTLAGKMKEKKCMEPREWDKIYNYKDLLDSMTYEQCGYDMYLYYYGQNAQNNIGVLWTAETNIYSVSDWSNTLRNYNSKIATESALSHRTTNTALSLYENHERTYPSHILLGVMNNQVDENRELNRGIIDVIKRSVKLFFNAQVTEKK